MEAVAVQINCNIKNTICNVCLMSIVFFNLEKTDLKRNVFMFVEYLSNNLTMMNMPWQWPWRERPADNKHLNGDGF